MSLKGAIPWNKGKKLSQKEKEKLSIAHKNNGGWNKGKIGIFKHSDTAKKKISITHQKEKHWNWKNGKSDTRSRIEGSYIYKKWRQDIFIRDDFTCQCCGLRGCILNAHHKKEFHILLDEAKLYLPLFDWYEAAMSYSPLWDIRNGITLCEKCHNLTKKGKGVKTKC